MTDTIKQSQFLVSSRCGIVIPVNDKLLTDYHVHTKRCGHATGEIRSYVDRAIALGLKEICFTDHLPLLHTIDRTLTMSWDDFPFYMADIDLMRQEYTEIKIKCGIEVDYLQRREAELESILSEYDFDFVLGSVHFVDGWGIDDRRYIDNYNNYDIDDLYRRYFTTLRSAAASGLFDALAHPDLIKKYNFRPRGDLRATYRETADAIAAAEIAVEVSSAGLRKPAKEIYPAQDFLNICASKKIPVTVGSDAHHPEEVGMDFDEVLRSLLAAGYSEVAIFTKRDRETMPLENA